MGKKEKLEKLVAKADEQEQKDTEMYTKESMLASFERYNQKNFIKVVQYLYNYQTPSEKRAGSSHYVNGVGFSKYDAPVALGLIDWCKSSGGIMTYRQFKAAQKMMKKYARQLSELKNNDIIRQKQMEYR